MKKWIEYYRYVGYYNFRVIDGFLCADCQLHSAVTLMELGNDQINEFKSIEKPNKTTL